MITLPSETRAVGSCILVVDDDEGVRENLAELFGLVGYSVLTAANATEAMEAMRKNSVDLLLTDYRMPGPNGLDRKSTRLNSSHLVISYAVFCLKKKKKSKY